MLYSEFLRVYLGFYGKMGAKIRIKSGWAKNLIAIFERRSGVEKC